MSAEPRARTSLRLRAGSRVCDNRISDANEREGNPSISSNETIGAGDGGNPSLNSRVVRCQMVGKRNSTEARLSKLAPSGVTGKVAKLHALNSEQPSACESFGEAMAVVITGVLPGARAQLDDERSSFVLQRDEKGRRTHIRDVPLGMEGGSKDQDTRRGYDLPDDSVIAQRLSRRLAPLRAKLGVRCTARVALESVKPSQGAQRRRRQIGHYDFEQRKCAKWVRALKAKRQRITCPWTLLVSLMEGGMLNLWCQGRWVVVRLNAGDAVLFRYDTWHGGASYDAAHWRVHEYWEPLAATEDFRKDRDGTLNLHQIEDMDTWNSHDRFIPPTSYEGPRYPYDSVMSSPSLGGCLMV